MSSSPTLARSSSVPSRQRPTAWEELYGAGLVGDAMPPSPTYSRDSAARVARMGARSSSRGSTGIAASTGPVFTSIPPAIQGIVARARKTSAAAEQRTSAWQQSPSSTWNNASSDAFTGSPTSLGLGPTTWESMAHPPPTIATRRGSPPVPATADGRALLPAPVRTPGASRGREMDRPRDLSPDAAPRRTPGYAAATSLLQILSGSGAVLPHQLQPTQPTPSASTRVGSSAPLNAPPGRIRGTSAGRTTSGVTHTSPPHAAAESHQLLSSPVALHWLRGGRLLPQTAALAPAPAPAPPAAALAPVPSSSTKRPVAVVEQRPGIETGLRAVPNDKKQPPSNDQMPTVYNSSAGQRAAGPTAEASAITSSVQSVANESAQPNISHRHELLAQPDSSARVAHPAMASSALVAQPAMASSALVAQPAMASSALVAQQAMASPIPRRIRRSLLPSTSATEARAVESSRPEQGPAPLEQVRSSGIVGVGGMQRPTAFAPLSSLAAVGLAPRSTAPPLAAPAAVLEAEARRDAQHSGHSAGLQAATAVEASSRANVAVAPHGTSVEGSASDPMALKQATAAELRALKTPGLSALCMRESRALVADLSDATSAAASATVGHSPSTAGWESIRSCLRLNAQRAEVVNTALVELFDRWRASNAVALRGIEELESTLGARTSELEALRLREESLTLALREAVARATRSETALQRIESMLLERAAGRTPRALGTLSVPSSSEAVESSVGGAPPTPSKPQSLSQTRSHVMPSTDGKSDDLEAVARSADELVAAVRHDTQRRVVTSPPPSVEESCGVVDTSVSSSVTEVAPAVVEAIATGPLPESVVMNLEALAASDPLQMPRPRATSSPTPVPASAVVAASAVPQEPISTRAASVEPDERPAELSPDAAARAVAGEHVKAFFDRLDGKLTPEPQPQPHPTAASALPSTVMSDAPPQDKVAAPPVHAQMTEPSEHDADSRVSTSNSLADQQVAVPANSVAATAAADAVVALESAAPQTVSMPEVAAPWYAEFSPSTRAEIALSLNPAVYARTRVSGLRATLAGSLGRPVRTFGTLDRQFSSELDGLLLLEQAQVPITSRMVVVFEAEKVTEVASQVAVPARPPGISRPASQEASAAMPSLPAHADDATVTAPAPSAASSSEAAAAPESPAGRKAPAPPAPLTRTGSSTRSMSGGSTPPPPPVSPSTSRRAKPPPPQRRYTVTLSSASSAAGLIPETSDVTGEPAASVASPPSPRSRQREQQHGRRSIAVIKGRVPPPAVTVPKQSLQSKFAGSAPRSAPPASPPQPASTASAPASSAATAAGSSMLMPTLSARDEIVRGALAHPSQGARRDAVARRLFTMIDTDGSGTVEAGELHAYATAVRARMDALATSGRPSNPGSPAEGSPVSRASSRSDDIFTAEDEGTADAETADGVPLAVEAAFCGAFVASEQPLQAVFESYDVNGDGKLDRDEFRRMCEDVLVRSAFGNRSPAASPPSSPKPAAALPSPRPTAISAAVPPPLPGNGLRTSPPSTPSPRSPLPPRPVPPPSATA